MHKKESRFKQRQMVIGGLILILFTEVWQWGCPPFEGWGVFLFLNIGEV